MKEVYIGELINRLMDMWEENKEFEKWCVCRAGACDEFCFSFVLART